MKKLFQSQWGLWEADSRQIRMKARIELILTIKKRDNYSWERLEFNCEAEEGSREFYRRYVDFFCSQKQTLTNKFPVQSLKELGKLALKWDRLTKRWLCHGVKYVAAKFALSCAGFSLAEQHSPINRKKSGRI